jgi:hypothetical protein
MRIISITLISIIMLVTIQETKAKSFYMPKFSVTVHNPSELDPERFKLELNLYCYYESPINRKDYECGSVKVFSSSTSVGEKGTIIHHFDAQTLQAERTSILNRKRREFHGWVNLYVDGKRIDSSGMKRGTRLESEKEMAGFFEEYKNIAFVEIPETRVKFEDIQGNDSVDYIINRFDPKQDRFLYKFEMLTKGYRESQELISRYMTIDSKMFGVFIREVSVPNFKRFFLNYNPNDKFTLKKSVNFAPYNWRDYTWYRNEVQQPHRFIEEKTLAYDFSDLKNGWPKEFVTFVINENWEQR